MRRSAARPVPFPPGPARSAVIQLTRAWLARGDARAARRSLWLAALDRRGLGFGSWPRKFWIIKILFSGEPRGGGASFARA